MLIAKRFNCSKDITDQYVTWLVELPYVATAKAVDFHVRYGMTPPTRDALRDGAKREGEREPYVQPPPRSLIARKESAAWAAKVREQLRAGELPSSTEDQSTAS